MEIFGHGDVTGVCGVVSVDGESAEEGTSPVDGDGVEFLEGLDEVVGVLFSDALERQSCLQRGRKLLVWCYASTVPGFWVQGQN